MVNCTMLVVVAIITQPCVGSERRLSVHPMITEAPEEAGPQRTPSPSVMDDVPVDPLTGSHAATQPVIASPAALLTVPPIVHPPIG